MHGTMRCEQLSGKAGLRKARSRTKIASTATNFGGGGGKVDFEPTADADKIFATGALSLEESVLRARVPMRTQVVAVLQNGHGRRPHVRTTIRSAGEGPPTNVPLRACVQSSKRMPSNTRRRRWWPRGGRQEGSRPLLPSLWSTPFLWGGAAACHAAADRGRLPHRRMPSTYDSRKPNLENTA